MATSSSPLTLSALYKKKADASVVLDDVKSYGIPSERISVIVKHQDHEIGEKDPHQSNSVIVTDFLTTGIIIGGLVGLLSHLWSVTLPGVGLFTLRSLNFLNLTEPLASVLPGTLIGLLSGLVVGLFFSIAEFQTITGTTHVKVDNQVLITIEVRNQEKQQVKKILNKYHPLSVTSYPAA